MGAAESARIWLKLEMRKVVVVVVDEDARARVEELGFAFVRVPQVSWSGQGQMGLAAEVKLSLGQWIPAAEA